MKEKPEEPEEEAPQPTWGEESLETLKASLSAL